MNIIILGAGLAGVTTAYQLMRDGHSITVIDREEAAAQFTSFANAGLVAPGHAYAWASSKAPAMMMRSLLNNDQAIRFKPQLFSLRFWSWCRKFLAQCNDASAAANTANKARLCVYGQQMLNEVSAETGLAYDGRKGGLVYFYRSPEIFAAAAAKADILRDAGIPIETLDRDQTIAKDPGLSDAADQIAGSVFAASDASGDANLFTMRLADHCAQRGVNFRYGETVERLEKTGTKLSAVITDKERYQADAYVVCLGVYAPHLIEPLGLKLPIYPVKGYSVTLHLHDRENGPQIGGVDEENLLAYCPMGDRLRLTATAEIGGYSTNHSPADFAAMMQRAEKLFGKVADFSKPKYWAGLRPMTPTGMPVVDRTSYDNLWLNTGHGHMGWTMSNGTARILADLVSQRQPAIDRKGMIYEY